MRKGRFILFIISASMLAMLPSGLDGAEADGEDTGAPAIASVQPETALRWSYVAISGTGLQSSDATCNVTVGGQGAYVESCSDDQIIAIVPWSTPDGSVVVSSDGMDSNLFSIGLEPATGSARDADIVPGVIEVLLAPEADMGDIDHSEGNGETSFEVFRTEEDSSQWYRVDVSDGQEIAKAIEYAADSDVLYAGPVSIPHTDDVPNDALYSEQWGLDKIDAESAWSVSKGDNVRLAVIDTGFQSSHSDLSAHMLSGWNCNHGTTTSPLNSHGTWTSGVAAAVTDNGPGSGSGIAGVGWNSRVLPLRLDELNGLGSCPPDKFDFLVSKAIDSGAKVINASIRYGWPNSSMCDALDDAWNAGIVVVASSGNDNTTAPQAPAACDHVISVAASDRDDSRSSYSNYGSYVDLSAPGGEGNGGLGCTPTLADRIRTTSTGGGYDWVCGTSFAAPHVAGAAALLAARGFYPCEIEETLKATAVSTPWQDGAGRLDAGAALEFWGGGPIVSQGNYPEGALIKEEGDTAVYIVSGGRKYLVSSAQEMSQMGLSSNNVQCVPYGVFNGIAEGPADFQIVTEFGSLVWHVMQCNTVFPTSDVGVLLQLVTQHGYEGSYAIPPGEIARLESTGHIASAPSAHCNLRETTTSPEYIMCPGGGSATKFKIVEGGLISPPDYVRQRLLGANPFRTLWDGALSSFPNGSLSSCPDFDGDGWSNMQESFLGTYTLDDCANTPTANNEPPPDTWPLDFNDDQQVTGSDVLKISAAYGYWASAPPYDPRLDLSMDGLISGPDLLKFGPYFGTSCG